MAIAPAVVAGVAIASSAIGTVATINAQKQQANAQAEASLAQALDAEERAQLAIERFGMIKELALQQRNRELELISGQRQAAQLEVEQVLLQNRLAGLQSQLQATSTRFQGDVTAMQAQSQGIQTQMGAESDAFNREQAAQNNLIGRGNEVIGALNEETQVGLQNANELEQAGAGLQQVQGAGAAIRGAGNSLARLGVEQGAIGAAADVAGQTNTNSQQRRGMAAFNTQMAGQNKNIAQNQLLLAQQYGAQGMNLADQYANLLVSMGDSQRKMAYLGAQATDTNRQYQDMSVQSSAAAQQRVNNIQAKRNRQAVNAGYQSTIATGNMTTLQQVMQEKQNIAAALAQANMARAQAPSGLSYLGAGLNAVSGAYQAGLFGGGGGGRVAAGGVITQMPPASGNPQGIVNRPPITWGQPLNSSGSTINRYPPITWGQPLNQYGQ